MLAGTPKRSRIPFKPLSIEEHRQRLPKALETLWTPEKLAAMPRLGRDHVFDLLIARVYPVRFVVTRELHVGKFERRKGAIDQPTELIHVSASGAAFCERRKRAAGYAQILRLIGIVVSEHPSQYTADAIHWQERAAESLAQSAVRFKT